MTATCDLRAHMYPLGSMNLLQPLISAANRALMEG